MRASLPTALRVSLSLGLTALFLWLAFSSISLDDLLDGLRGAHPQGLVLGVAAMFASNLPRAWRWRVLMKSVAAPPFTQVLQAVLCGYAANNFVPRSGELTRVLYIRGEGASGTGLLASVVVERTLDLLSLLAILGVVLLVVQEDVAGAYPWMEGVLLSTTAVAVIALAVVAVVGDRAIAFVQTSISRISEQTGARVADLLETFISGLPAVRDPKGYSFIAVSTVLLNICYILSIYFPFSSFGFDLGLGEAVVVMAIATIGVVIPTPGGTGTYHMFCSQALTRLYGVPNDEALVFATAIHAGVFLMFTATGGPFLLRLLWGRTKSH